jgi:hypothetical protein
MAQRREARLSGDHMLLLLFFAIVIFVLRFFFTTARENDANPYLWMVIGMASFLIPHFLASLLLGSISSISLISIAAGVIVASAVLNFLQRLRMER